jgi:hypothetical protein
VAVTVEGSGTQAASISTEHTLHTDSDAKVFVLEVDTAAMVAGDVLELRCYGILLAGGTEHLVFEGTFAHAQSEPIKTSIPFPSPGQTNGFRATLKQTAGTGRSFPWSVVSV